VHFHRSESIERRIASNNTGGGGEVSNRMPNVKIAELPLWFKIAVFPLAPF